MCMRGCITSSMLSLGFRHLPFVTSATHVRNVELVERYSPGKHAEAVSHPHTVNLGCYCLDAKTFGPSGFALCVSAGDKTHSKRAVTRQICKPEQSICFTSQPHHYKVHCVGKKVKMRHLVTQPYQKQTKEEQQHPWGGKKTGFCTHTRKKN